MPPKRQKLCALITQHNPVKLPTNIIKQCIAFRRQLVKFCELQQFYQPELSLAPLSPDDNEIGRAHVELQSPC